MRNEDKNEERKLRTEKCVVRRYTTVRTKKYAVKRLTSSENYKQYQESELAKDESEGQRNVGLADTLKQVPRVSKVTGKNKELCC